MSAHDALKRYVGGELNRLDEGRRADRAASIARLAQLRTSLRSHSPGPAYYAVLTSDLFPEELVGSSDQLSPGESAAVDALSLYAHHQQGVTETMHQRAQTLGISARRLTFGVNPYDEQTVLMRLHRIGSARSRANQIIHLAGLVELLKANRVPTDYVALASDLYQCAWGDHDSIHLRWARQFHMFKQPLTKKVDQPTIKEQS